MKALAIALAAALLTPAAASADWQNTTWSMTKAETIKATGAAEATGLPGNSVHGADLGAKGVYQALGYSFTSEFYFSRADSLRVVRLMLDDPAECGQLQTDLEGLYGAPMERDRIGLRWADPLANNSIRFTTAMPPHSPTCFIAYTPILAGGGQGL